MFHVFFFVPSAPISCEFTCVHQPLIELDDGKIYRKALYLMVKTMVSCRFSLKPIQWTTGTARWSTPRARAPCYQRAYRWRWAPWVLRISSNGPCRSVVKNLRGKPMGKHGKTMEKHGKAWENNGKTMKSPGKPRKMIYIHLHAGICRSILV